METPFALDQSHDTAELDAAWVTARAAGMAARAEIQLHLTCDDSAAVEVDNQSWVSALLEDAENSVADSGVDGRTRSYSCARASGVPCVAEYVEECAAEAADV